MKLLFPQPKTNGLAFYSPVGEEGNAEYRPNSNQIQESNL